MGLVILVMVGAPQIRPIFVGLFALSSAIPVLTSLRRASTRDLAESHAVSAVEHARAVVMQAASLKEWLAQPEPARSFVADALLTNIEQAAAVVGGREHRSTLVSNEQARRHVRIRPLRSRVVVTRSDELAILAELVDVSISGAAIRGDIPDVNVGEEVQVGSRNARVVRLLPDGIACEFVTPLAPELLDFDIEL